MKKLGEHSRNKSGQIHKERGDSLIKNLREAYPQLAVYHGNTMLSTVLADLGVSSLSQALKKLRKK